MDMQKQLLDPIGTVCKLISLNFNKIKTKISIHNHILTLQEPNGYQPFIRLVNGDERNNISELYYAIIRLIQWYVIEDEDMTDETLSICKDPTLKRIIRYVCDAFRKLQETYREGNVVLTLQFYINTLEDAVEGRFTMDRLPKYLLEQERTYSNLLDYEKIKNLWTINKLKRICEAYDNCYDVLNSEKNPETQNRYLEAYLQSVALLLDASDREFKELINNSQKG